MVQQDSKTGQTALLNNGITQYAHNTYVVLFSICTCIRSSSTTVIVVAACAWLIAVLVALHLLLYYTCVLEENRQKKSTRDGQWSLTDWTGVQLGLAGSMMLTVLWSWMILVTLKHECALSI